MNAYGDIIMDYRFKVYCVAPVPGKPGAVKHENECALYLPVWQARSSRGTLRRNRRPRWKLIGWFASYQDAFNEGIRLTPLQADAARPGEAEQLAFDAAQLKHGRLGGKGAI